MRAGWVRFLVLGAILTGLMDKEASSALSQEVKPYKLKVTTFGLAPEPLSKDEYIFLKDRIYLIPLDEPEMIVVDRSESIIDLIHTKKRCQCELSIKELNQGIDKHRANLFQKIDTQEGQGGRANRLESKMARELVEARLSVTNLEGAGRWRMVNGVVEVEAEGKLPAPPVDSASLRLALETRLKIFAIRSPKDMPPFVELAALKEIFEVKKLAPTSISTIYRLAGPPLKVRRTYSWSDEVTDRDLRALSLVETLRETTPHLRYAKYREATSGGN